MGPITRFRNAVAETFEEIKEVVGLQKYQAIGSMSATERNAPRPLTTFFQRSSRQISKEQDGRPLPKRASESVPFEIRFQLLVLFIRQKCTGSLAGLKALEADVKALKSITKINRYQHAHETLEAMSVSLKCEIALKHTASDIPLPTGPIYGGW
jgi:hypothetical protein